MQILSRRAAILGVGLLCGLASGASSCIFQNTGGQQGSRDTRGGVDSGDVTGDTGVADGEADGSQDGGGGDAADGGDTSIDGGDTSIDGGDTTAPVPPVDLYYFTGGGVTATSDSYRIQATVGPETPPGKASSSSYRIEVAPVSP